MKIPSLVAAAVMAALSCSCGDSSASASPLRIVAIPDQAKSQLRDDQKEIGRWLGAKLGVPVEVIPVENYGAAVVALVTGAADLGWLGGVTTVQAMKQSSGAVMPVVTRKKDLKFKSYIVVAGASPAQSVADLKGKSFTFGAMDSTSGHVMPRFLMAKEQGVKKAEEFFSRVAYSGNHTKTITDVRDGAFDAGAVNYSVYDQMLADGGVTAEQVRVLWTTPEYVDYAWCARGDLDQRFGAGTVNRIRDAFVGLDGSDAQEKTVMTANNNADGFLAADPKWWDGIKAVMEMPELASAFKN